MSFSDLAFVDATGIHSPDYPTVFEFIKDQYRAIYGADVYLEADSPDAQWLAIMALALYNASEENVAVYNSFSPQTAQSAALTSNVKINGISRSAPTYSQVDLTIVGTFGTVITNGVAQDTLNQKWDLPSPTNIPFSGQIIVTAQAQEIGAIQALAGTVNKIATPTNGWQSVNNLNDAAIGEPVETDAELRATQTVSTMIPNLTVLDGIIGAVKTLTGVTEVSARENDTNFISGSLPPHSISLVVEGGVSQEIADTIYTKKGSGTGTFGTTSIVSVDARGVPNTINFFRPTNVPIFVEITLDALVGYTNAIGDEIKQAVTDYINNLGFGKSVLTTKLYCPANLEDIDAVGSETFDIQTITTRRDALPYTEANINIEFFENPITITTNIIIVII